MATREEAVSRYESWLNKTSDLDVEPERRDWILKHLHLLKSKDLGCCKDKPCHGYVLLSLLSRLN